MSLEASYSQLQPTDQMLALEQIEDDIWNTRDRLAALIAGRAVLMNLLKGEDGGE